MNSSPKARHLARSYLLWVACALAASGSAHAVVKDEIWPELDLWFQLTTPLRLLLTDSGVRDSESGDKSQGAYGANVDYRLNQHISFRAGYRYFQNLTLATGARADVEHRQVYDFNYYWRPGDGAQIVDRTRFEVRDQEGRTTYRYRNRISFSREVRIRQVRLVPYASAEAFYDTKFAELNRLQFRLGSQLPTGPNLAWDFFLARQRDTYPVTKFVNALGVTLVIKY